MAAEVREIAYEDNSDFNNEFDENNQALIIGDITLNPSWMLYNTDYDLYLTTLDEYNENQRQDFIDSVYDYFPMPIAYYFRQTQMGARDNNEQLQLLRSTWEAIIFVLYAVVISEARKHSFHLRSMRVTERDVFNFSLNTKLNTIENIIRHDIANDNILWSTQNFNLADISAIKTLNHARNGFQHSAPLSELQAKNKYLDLFPEVLGALMRLNALERVNILHFIRNNSNLLSLRCEIFNGYSSNRTYNDINITQDVLNNSLPEINDNNVLVQLDDTLFSISPFIHFIEDEDGHLTNLCYFHQIDNNDNTKYKFEIVRRSRYLQIDKSEFSYFNSEYSRLTQRTL